MYVPLLRRYTRTTPETEVGLQHYVLNGDPAVFVGRKVIVVSPIPLQRLRDQLSHVVRGSVPFQGLGRFVFGQFARVA